MLLPCRWQAICPSYILGIRPFPTLIFRISSKQGRAFFRFTCLQVTSVFRCWVLSIALSYLMPGHHPGLLAGWVLNSILYTATGVFLCLVAKKVLGSAGIWFTLIVLINPIAVKWLCHPVAETTFIFFIVMTFYFMLRPTRWAYLPAMLTSMVRYERRILILLCFCIDFFSGKNWKSRLFSFLRAGLAALPLALWMFGMIASRKPGASAGSLPYIRNYAVTKQMVIGKFATYVWSNGVSSLFVLPRR